jgi:peptidoglycan-associated lipoprotein
MKMNKRLVTLLVLGLACVMVTPGCRKTSNIDPETGLNLDVVGGNRLGEGLDGEDIGVGVRFPEGEPYPGEFAPVYFDYDSARLKSGERMKADAVASEMRSAPQSRLVLEGHCDERGDREYNLALGERRALAVRAYIIELGIGADRITTKSFGEESPAAFGHDEASYQLNRRSELRLPKGSPRSPVASADRWKNFAVRPVM